MTVPHHVHTPDEFLFHEAHFETRHEYVEGHIYAMGAASPPHNRVVANVIAAVHAQLRGRPCDVFTGDQLVRVGPRAAYLRPDTSGLCGSPEYERHPTLGLDTLVNPAFVVEVLSPSTEGYDRGRKYSLYQRIPALREYVLVAQDHVHAERYTRPAEPGAAWERADADGPDGVVELPSVGAALRLGDLYERVTLPAHPARPRRVREPAPAESGA